MKGKNRHTTRQNVCEICEVCTDIVRRLKYCQVRVPTLVFSSCSCCSSLLWVAVASTCSSHCNFCKVQVVRTKVVAVKYAPHNFFKKLNFVRKKSLWPFHAVFITNRDRPLMDQLQKQYRQSTTDDSWQVQWLCPTVTPTMFAWFSWWLWLYATLFSLCR